MTLARQAVVVASVLLFLLAVFQPLLATGVPWGRAAWHGAHRVLPRKPRWASLAATPGLLFAGWVILARTDLTVPWSAAFPVRVMVWAFAVFFSLNTIGNLTSTSRIERILMTPVPRVLAACFLIVALS